LTTRSAGWARIFAALRAVTTVAIVAWLASRVRLRPLHELGWRPETMAWLAGALALTVAGVVLAALRWQRVLVALEVPATTGHLVRHYLASLFVGNVLPSTIGGDVLRVSRLASSSGDGARALASVVLERLTGWLVLPLLTLVGLAANPGLRRIAPGPARSALGLALVTVALLAVAVVLASSPALGRSLGKSQGWRRFAGAVHLGVERIRRAPGLAFEVLTVGFAYQLVVVAAAFLAARALGIGVGWTALLAFFPVVAIVQVLPVTVGGLGTREAALIFFLHPFGVPDAHAFALGLLVYVLNLGVSLLGAPAFAAGGRPARAIVHS
jgi:uncharacterized membrane protein YbhN (UPF0104 family)